MQGVGYTFNERIPDNDFPQQRLDAGLAAVKIVCYTETDETSYEPLYYEYYRDGKKDYKVDFLRKKKFADFHNKVNRQAL